MSGASVTVLNELFDATGAGGKNSKSSLQTGNENKRHPLLVRNPSHFQPYPLHIENQCTENGTVIDPTSTRTGFRSFMFDPDKGFALNGEWMKMKGVCIHHDAGVLGSAVPREVWKRRLETLKEVGVNAIRTSHNPQAPDLYELCDELGILVLNEMYDEWVFPSASGWKDGMWELPDFRAPSIFSKSGAKLTLPIWYVAIGTMFLSLPGASATRLITPTTPTRILF